MSDPALGREIGSYQIVDLLGHGGMGKVYRAQHPYIGKQVAIKLLKSDLSAQTDVVKRFFQEAKAVNDIRHENVIDVLDFGRSQDGEYFIIMELLEGRTLSQALKNDAPFPAKRAGHVSLQICSALAAAHDKNIIHRDLKSDNIYLVTRAGQKDFVKVLDFGIAKLLDGSASTNTTTGMVMGTPLYMAPEQALGKPLDAQTDVYALGVILYQMATGTVPFFDPNPVALATMHVTAKVPRPSERYPNVDPKFEKIILRCLEKEKDSRYPNMRVLGAALAEVFGIDTATYFGEEFGNATPTKLEPTAIDTAKTATPTSKELSGEIPGGTPIPKSSSGQRGVYAVGVGLLVAAAVFVGFTINKAPTPTINAPTPSTQTSALSKKIVEEPIKTGLEPVATQPVSSPATKPATQPASSKIKPIKPIIKPIKTGPIKPDPTKPDPTKPDPTKPDPAKPDPTKPDPTKPPRAGSGTIPL